MKPPQFGAVNARPVSTAKGSQVMTATRCKVMAQFRALAVFEKFLNLPVAVLWRFFFFEFSVEMIIEKISK